MYSRPICAELEASPVSPPNWAGLARALYIYKPDLNIYKSDLTCTAGVGSASDGGLAASESQGLLGSAGAAGLGFSGP